MKLFSKSIWKHCHFRKNTPESPVIFHPPGYREILSAKTVRQNGAEYRNHPPDGSLGQQAFCGVYPMLTLLIIALIIFAIGGGGYGYRSGWYGGPRGTGFNGLGLLPIILLVIALFLLLHTPGSAPPP
ncbi:hypothetical protein [Komagataeibacter oboediens]